MGGLKRISGSFDFDKISMEAKKEIAMMPTIIGRLAVNHFKEGFEKGGYMTDKSANGWKERNPGTPLNEGRNILVGPGSGRLRNSIRVIRRSKRGVVVGTRKPYAEIHNYGRSVPITAKSRKYFWAKYMETGNEFWKNLALTKKTSFEVPQREFIGESKKLEEKIYKFIRTRLSKVL